MIHLYSPIIYLVHVRPTVVRQIYIICKELENYMYCIYHGVECVNSNETADAPSEVVNFAYGKIVNDKERCTNVYQRN